MTRTAEIRAGASGEHEPSRHKKKEAGTTAPSWDFNSLPQTGAATNASSALYGMKRLGAFNLGMARFFAERARKNAGLIASLATCRSPHDAIEAWRDAAVEAVEDYTAETERLMDMQKH